MNKAILFLFAIFLSVAGIAQEAYHKGSIGSFDFNEGVGVSLKLNDQLNIHGLLTHSYMRYYGRLSASGAAFLDGVYFNYFGVRMGASFRF